MSVDDRIRGGMIANGTAHRPAVESSLDEVRSRGRRDRTSRLLLAAGSAAAVSAIVLIMARPFAIDGAEPTTPAPAPRPMSALFGTYESDVTSPVQLAGHWVLRLGGNGTITVIPPDGYAGVVSGTLLSADDTTLATNLFGQDVCADQGNGEFQWNREGTRLVLQASNDPCTARRTVFTGNSWVEVPGS